LKLPFSPGASPGLSPAATQRIEPQPPAHDEPRDAVRNDGWGFADTAFGVTADGHITVTGNRYPGLSGQVLPNLLPWFRRVIAVDFPLDTPGGSYPPPVGEPRRADGFFAALDGTLADDQVSTDPAVRLRRGHGHTVAEMDAVRSDGFARVPD
jgi:alkyldihydroxyacetonephosphate synthase